MWAICVKINERNTAIVEKVLTAFAGWHRIFHHPLSHGMEFTSTELLRMATKRNWFPQSSI